MIGFQGIASFFSENRFHFSAKAPAAMGGYQIGRLYRITQLLCGTAALRKKSVAGKGETPDRLEAQYLCLCVGIPV